MAKPAVFAVVLLLSSFAFSQCDSLDPQPECMNGSLSSQVKGVTHAESFRYILIYSDPIDLEHSVELFRYFGAKQRALDWANENNVQVKHLFNLREMGLETVAGQYKLTHKDEQFTEAKEVKK